VLMPMAALSGYGYTFDVEGISVADRSPLFSTMTKFVPLEVWGAGWWIVAALSLVGGITASWQLLRIATIVGWSLATGALFSVVYARWSGVAATSAVGISWSYSVWASCGFSVLWAHLAHRPPTREHRK